MESQSQSKSKQRTPLEVWEKLAVDDGEQSFLPVHQIMYAMQLLNLDPAQADIGEVMRDMGLDGNGDIVFDEFLMVYAAFRFAEWPLLSGWGGRREMREALRILESDVLKESEAQLQRIKELKAQLPRTEEARAVAEPKAKDAAAAAPSPAPAAAAQPVDPAFNALFGAARDSSGPRPGSADA
eukprot:gene9342-10880_t